jgi:hypothetical protein
MLNALAFRMREDGVRDGAPSEVFRLVEDEIVRDGLKGYRSKELSTVVWAFDRLELSACSVLRIPVFWCFRVLVCVGVMQRIGVFLGSKVQELSR